ncbi:MULTISPECIES: hypothetical protein [unclassified Paenibacillus]|uniref:hypothetical protein n=1 Tax=unclassified Paenibacillus TaxID=185978 RepID=UPI00104B9DEB|nr:MULTISPECIES: hypothetical protein [unclassified Paenibacillus]NIK71817.1 glucan phosphoethanolaminetransferase (alkaline phosphatase superfamily) [Paenibacillus sp. BK720]TCM96469.1 hypothetical protein EV294_105336 [Paenibacillus sp. BK033]
MILQLIVFALAAVGWSWYRVLQIKQPGAAVLFASLMTIVVVAGCLWIAHIPLPSSTTPIRGLFEPIGKIIARPY